MSAVKIKIESLYKIFGKNPKAAMEQVKNGVDKNELLEKYNQVLGLKDINLNIREKSIQVVMGLSGSGKSTLLSLIPRIYDADLGDIQIDEQSIYNIKLSSLRKNISIVSC